jgi:hypothetical protein
MILFFKFRNNVRYQRFLRFDAAAGVGLDFELLSFGVRYNYGLTKVGKEKTLRVDLHLS